MAALRAEIEKVIENMLGDIKQDTNTILHFYMRHKPTNINTICQTIEEELTAKKQLQIEASKKNGVADNTIHELEIKITNIQNLKNKYAGLAGMFV